MIIIPERHRKKAAWITLAIAGGVAGFQGIGGLEGMRTTPYFDIGGVPTACFGETQNIRMNERFTRAQCVEMLGNRVENNFGPGVDKCVHHALPNARKAAYVSFAYNEGVHAFCNSSIAKLENTGDPVGACNAIMEYNKVKVNGVKTYSPGLNNRRVEERALCMRGIT